MDYKSSLIVARWAAAIAALALPAGDALAANAPARGRVVYLGGGLTEEQVITLSAAVAAADPDAVFLLDGPQAGPYLRHFLQAFHAERIVPVGSFPEGRAALAKRLAADVEPVQDVGLQGLLALYRKLFPTPAQVICCPAGPRGQFLRAACLAGSWRAPLIPLHGGDVEAQALRALLADWRPRQLYVVGEALKQTPPLALPVLHLADEKAVAAAHVQSLRNTGSVQALVVANPADSATGRGPMSLLAPWVALKHQGVLLLTNPAGDNTPALVKAAEPLDAGALILVAGLKAVPMERRPNPIPGKDAEIEMEPLTPKGPDLFSYDTGRLFHPDPGVVLLMLARRRLLDDIPAARPHKALVVSNPGGGLPLLETFSRNTAKEFRNRGYRTVALFEDEVNKDTVRKLVPDQDVFLWEGHYRTLIDEYGFPEWSEPLAPSLVFLQSCLALNEKEAQPLLQRGAVAVVGSPSRIYSGTGGAFTLAFFDGMLYDSQTLGGSLRQAKNFLLAYARLKEQRLGDAKLAGANLRSAWAFTLWGDPTVRLPAPAPPADEMPPVRSDLRGHTVVLSLPGKPYDKVTTRKYQAQMRPNSRLAGLLVKETEEDGQRFVPFFYAEVPLPKPPPGKKPRLVSGLSQRHWVFCWDPRRSAGYLLVAPRPHEKKEELHFRLDWQD